MNKFSKKRILKLTIFLFFLLLFFIFILFPIISILGPDTFFRGTKDYILMLIEKRLHIRILSVLLPIIILLLLFPLLSIIYPFLSSFFERFWRYPSLFFICLRKKYSFKVNNFKFTNSYKINEIPNVTINHNEKTYFLHFLDIPKADKRVVIFQNANEYRVYETIKKKQCKITVYNCSFMENEDIPTIFRKRPRFLDENNYQSFEIPNFSNSDNCSHIVLVSPHFIYLNHISNHINLDITRETQIGTVVVSKFKKFKKNM